MSRKVKKIHLVYDGQWIDKNVKYPLCQPSTPTPSSFWCVEIKDLISCKACLSEMKRLGIKHTLVEALKHRTRVSDTDSAHNPV